MMYVESLILVEEEHLCEAKRVKNCAKANRQELQRAVSPSAGLQNREKLGAQAVRRDEMLPQRLQMPTPKSDRASLH